MLNSRTVAWKGLAALMALDVVIVLLFVTCKAPPRDDALRFKAPELLIYALPDPVVLTVNVPVAVLNAELGAPTLPPPVVRLSANAVTVPVVCVILPALFNVRPLNV